MGSLVGHERQHGIIHFGEELIALLYVASVECGLAEFHVLDRRCVVGIVQAATLDAIRLGHNISKLLLQLSPIGCTRLEYAQAEEVENFVYTRQQHANLNDRTPPATLRIVAASHHLSHQGHFSS